MPIGDIYRVRAVMQKGQQIAFNVHHYRADGVLGTEATNTEIATQISAAWHTEYKAVMDNSATYYGVDCQRVRPLPPTFPGFSTADQGLGSIALSDLLPKQVSGIISWVTQFAGPGFRGRTYVAFPSEVDNDDDGAPQPGYVTRLVALGGKIRLPPLITGVGGGQITLGHGVYRRVLQAFNPSIFGLARPRWATQRRRGDYGRINAPPF